MFEYQLPNGICRTVALLRSLDPVGTHLEDNLSTGHTELPGTHTTTQLALGIKDDEVIDTLLVKRSSGNDARHTTPEDKDGGMIRRSGRRIGILGEHN